MRHALITLALVLGFAAACGTLALAAQETPIYTGNLASAPVPFTIGGWGNATVEESSEVRLAGASSIKLASSGDFQGGRVDFATPLDISTYAGQRNAYIEIWIRPYFARPEAAPPAAAAAGGPAGARPGLAPGVAPAPAAAGVRRRVGREAEEEQPAVSAPATTTPRVRTGFRRPLASRRTVTTGATQPPTAAQTSATAGTSAVTARRRAISRLRAATTPAPVPSAPAPPPGPASIEKAAFRTPGFRVQLFTDRGMAVLPDYPIYPADRNDAGWIRVGFPLVQFDGGIGDKLQRLVIFSQRADTIYIGEMRLMLDTSSIEARPVAYPAITSVGRPITFVANARAGLTPVKVEWDFDNADGIKVEAQGQRVMNVYTRPGAYEATCTISDATGANRVPLVYVLLVRVK